MPIEFLEDTVETVTPQPEPQASSRIEFLDEPVAAPQPQRQPTALETLAPMTASVVKTNPQPMGFFATVKDFFKGPEPRTEAEREQWWQDYKAKSGGVGSAVAGGLIQAGQPQGGMPAAMTPTSAENLGQQQDVAQDIAPLAAGMVAPGALPAAVGRAAIGGGIGARLGANALQGVVGGGAVGAMQGAEKLAEGDVAGAAKEVGKEAAIGAVAGPVGGEVLRFAGKGLIAAKELVTSGKDRVGLAFATAIRPFNPSVGAVESQQARDLIASRTGVTIPPTGVSEVLGNPKISEEIKNSVPGSELSAETIDEIKRQVVTAAAGVKNLGMTAEDLSNSVLGVLRNQLGTVSKNSEDAIKALTAELEPAIKGAVDEVQNAAKALVPGTAATPTTLGARIRGALSDAYDQFKATDRANYAAVEALPETKTVVVVPNSTKQWASSVFGKALKDKAGNPIGSTLPPETKKFVQEVSDIGDSQSLEAMRAYRTQIGDAAFSDTILPGLSSAQKKQLYGALTKDIDDAVSSLPSGQLKSALQEANSFHKQNVDRFVGRTTESVLKEFGAEGGAGPAAIVEKLRSKDGPTLLETFERTAGKDQADKLVGAVKEYLYNDIGSKARNPLDGSVSVGKMVNDISDLPKEIQQRFFPQLKEVVNLAKREGAIKGLDPTKIAKTLEVDPVLLNEALTTKSPDVMNRLKTAVQESNRLSQELRGSVLGALAKNSAQQVTDSVSQNPIKFVRSLTDGTFTPKESARALDLIGRNDPQLLAQLQFNYVDDLLGSYATQRGISASNMAKDLSRGGAAAGPGELRATTEAVLGTDKTDGLLEVIQSLAKLESNQTKLTASTPLADVLVKGAGGLLGEVAGRNLRIGPIGAANQAAWLFREYRDGRYRLVAHMLTTPELRKLAMTPISQVSKDAINGSIRGTVSAVAAVEGKDSPTIDELEGMAVELNR